jgi:hypothetical protein
MDILTRRIVRKAAARSTAFPGAIYFLLIGSNR